MKITQSPEGLTHSCKVSEHHYAWSYFAKMFSIADHQIIADDFLLLCHDKDLKSTKKNPCKQNTGITRCGKKLNFNMEKISVINFSKRWQDLNITINYKKLNQKKTWNFWVSLSLIKRVRKDSYRFCNFINNSQLFIPQNIKLLQIRCKTFKSFAFL